jgi:hypothetical protein
MVVLLESPFPIRAMTELSGRLHESDFIPLKFVILRWRIFIADTQHDANDHYEYHVSPIESLRDIMYE